VAAIAAGDLTRENQPILPGPHPLFDEDISAIRTMCLGVAVARCFRGRFVTLSRGKYSFSIIEKCTTYSLGERPHVLEEIFVTGGLPQGHRGWSVSTSDDPAPRKEVAEESVVPESIIGGAVVDVDAPKGDEGKHLPSLLADPNAAVVVQTALQTLHPRERRRVVLLVQPHLHVFEAPGTPIAVLAKWLSLCSKLLASVEEEESYTGALGSLPAADPESLSRSFGNVSAMPTRLLDDSGADDPGGSSAMDFSYLDDDRGSAPSAAPGSRFAFAREELQNGPPVFSRLDRANWAQSATARGGLFGGRGGEMGGRPRNREGVSGDGSSFPLAADKNGPLPWGTESRDSRTTPTVVSGSPRIRTFGPQDDRLRVYEARRATKSDTHYMPWERKYQQYSGPRAGEKL
jgi:hypothetical protein